MTKKIHTNKTCRFFYKTRKVLGETYLTKLYSRGKTAVFTWAANPEHCSEIRRNPLDRLKENMVDLHGVGETEAVLAAADILLEPLGHRAQPIKKPEPAGDNVEAEILDSYKMLTKLYDSIEEGANLQDLRHLIGKVEDKLHGIAVLYEKKNRAEGT